MPEPVIRNTFRKPEKLCSQNQIDRLFAEGKALASKQFRLLYIETDEAALPAVKVLIAVSIKIFKHAVSRNRMKRLIREAYRINKHKILEVYEGLGKHCDIAIIFTGKKHISQQETNIAIIELLDRLILNHEKNSK